MNNNKVESDDNNYNGWKVMNPETTNVTAKQLMTDTSGFWEINYISSHLRIYRKRSNGSM